jgi:hypothetical protein
MKMTTQEIETTLCNACGQFYDPQQADAEGHHKPVAQMLLNSVQSLSKGVYGSIKLTAIPIFQIVFGLTEK